MVAAAAIHQEAHQHRKKSLMWYLAAPLRALGKAKDFYVDSMTRCASGQIAVGSYGMGPGSSAYGFSRSSSTNDDDFRELVRAVSQGRLGKLNVEGLAAASTVPRSQSVAIGRIDEDAPMEFGADLRLGVGAMFPRSRSCAVPARRTNRVGVAAA